MYALLRILVVNTLWRWWRGRERDQQLAAHWRATHQPLPIPEPPVPPARMTCPDCTTDLPASARFCPGCLKRF